MIFLLTYNAWGTGTGFELLAVVLAGEDGAVPFIVGVARDPFTALPFVVELFAV